jgi:thiamine pyrophosphokinase
MLTKLPAGSFFVARGGIVAGKEKAVTVFVLANGDLESLDWARSQLAMARAIVAANGGAAHVLATGFWPDTVIGDMDSIATADQRELDAKGTQVIRHPEAKDETDLELALLHAAATYEEPIRVLAGLGGRLDQWLANILLLLHPGLRGRDVRFLTPYQQLWIAGSRTAVDGAAGDTVSLIPLGGDVHVLETTGLAWPLRDELLTVGPARGISNEMTGPRATVVVARGDLLCVHTKQEWGR